MATFSRVILAWLLTTFGVWAQSEYIPIESISGSIAPYVDKDGYVNPIINLGDINFGGGLVLPLSLNFSSAIRSPSPEFGQGWECPLFDAKIFDTQRDVKRMETLGGKDRYLVYNPRTGNWNHFFTDNWNGKVDGDYFDLTYKNGVKFVFNKGLISSISLPDGKTILWNRQNGKLISMQLSGQPPAFEITYDKLGFAQELLLHPDKAGKAKKIYKFGASLIYAGINKIECPGGRAMSFEESKDKALNPVLKWTDTSRPTVTVGWSATTGKILSDDKYTYQITEVGKENGWPKMGRTGKATGSVESYYFNQNNGICDEVLPGGIARRVETIQAPGPTYKDVRLIQETKDGNTRTVLRRAFDDKGRVVLETLGLASGKEVTQQFTYDDAGRIVSFVLNGKEKWKNVYDPATGQLIERDLDDLGVKLAFSPLTGGQVQESVVNAKGETTSTKTLDSNAWQAALSRMQRVE